MSNDVRKAPTETPLSVACECLIMLMERLPRDPTPAMVGAGTAAHAASPYFEAARIVNIWQAMYDAAIAKSEQSA